MWLAFATTLLVVLLSAAFAALRNSPSPTAVRRGAAPPPREPATVSPPPFVEEANAAPVDVGQRASERLNCAMCHSIAGRGNLNSPLDGVGGRLDRGAILAWTTARGDARDHLSPSTVRRKTLIAEDPDMAALVDYLARLK